MPVIKIWCRPATREEELRLFHKAIVAAVVSIPELGLRDETQMTTLFPTDMMAYGLGSEVIVEVTGLFEKPQRDMAVRRLLAERLGKAVSGFYPQAKVECFVNTFNPRQGFWSSSDSASSQIDEALDGPWRLRYSPDFDPNPFASEGFRVIDHDERESALEEVDLRKLVIHTGMGKRYCRRDELMAYIKSLGEIRLGVRFAVNLYNNPEALKWLWEHRKVRRISIFGTTFAHDEEGRGRTMYIHRKNVGDRDWLMRLDSRFEKYLVMGAKIPTLAA